MSEGMAAVQARISELQALLRGPASASATSSGSTSATTKARGTAFADVLAQAGLSGGSGDLGQQAVEIAKTYVGTEYRWGGTDPKSGLDCSGLTQLVYRQLGVELPRVSADQARAGEPVASLAQAKPGDLVFLGSPVHHVGIYAGDGMMVDAPRAGKLVQVRKVNETPSAIRRVLPQEPAGVTGLASGLQALLGSASTGGLASTGGRASTTGSPSSAMAGTPYADLFSAAGRRYGVDPALLSAVAKAESSYNPAAVSRAGARGLMQLMPATARSLGVNPDVPVQAVDGAARLLSDHLRSFQGRVDLALAAYNAGPGAVRKYGGVPPYDETRTYVSRVTSNWGDLR